MEYGDKPRVGRTGLGTGKTKLIGLVVVAIVIGAGVTIAMMSSRNNDDTASENITVYESSKKSVTSYL